MRKIILFLLLLSSLPLSAGTGGSLRTAKRLYNQKKYGQAQAIYNQILQENPTDREAAIGVGDAAYYLKDYGAAETAFKQVAEQDSPRQNDALFNLGNTYYRNNKREEAKQAYRQVILKNPKDKEALHNLQFILAQQQSEQDKKQDSPDQKDKDNNNGQGGADNQKQDNTANQPQSSAPSQAEKDAAESVMQMAKNQEHKATNNTTGNVANDLIEKDW